MSDSPAPPGPLGLLVSRLLGDAASLFLGERAGDAEVAGVLGELVTALRLHHDLTQNKYPPRGSVAARSRALAGFEAAVAAAVRHYRAAASPTVLPAGLEVVGGAVERDLQRAASSVMDRITLRDAAWLLGLKSSEPVRRRIHAGELPGWQDEDGRREWRTSRAAVIAYRDRRSAA